MVYTVCSSQMISEMLPEIHTSEKCCFFSQTNNSFYLLFVVGLPVFGALKDITNSQFVFKNYVFEDKIT